MAEKRARTPRKPLNTRQLFAADAATFQDDLDYLIGGAPEQTADRARERGLVVLQLAAASIAPDPHQLRRLPHPDVLQTLAAQGDMPATATLAGLRDLGASMQEHGQIQPVIVYADSDADPAVAYRLLHGQRRWSAAWLADIATLAAIVVERPQESARLQRQFDENEQREGFSDMERAWAITALRQTLTSERGETVPWAEVEARLRLSDSRRRDLLRLLRFPDAVQDVVLRYRWPEWTLRPLHMAVNANTLTTEQTLAIIDTLTTRDAVSAPLVAALVSDYQPPMEESGTFVSPSATGTTPKRRRGETAGLPAALRALAKVDQALAHARSVMHTVDDAETEAAVMDAVARLLEHFDTFVAELGTGSRKQE